MIEFFVPGIPAPGGSKKAFPIHTGRFKPNKKGIPTEIVKVVVTDAAGQKNKNWRSSVIDACRSVFTSVPLRGPLKMNVIFYMPYRKGDFGSGKKNKGILKKDAPKYPITKPDCTKLLRSTEDALSSILWVDDAQITEQNVKKVYGLRPGAKITVEPIEDESWRNGETSQIISDCMKLAIKAESEDHFLLP